MKTIDQLKEEIKTAENDFEKKVLINNFKAVFYSDDVINAVFTVVNKYTGKKIGDKTREKINAELNSVYPGLSIWFSTEYNGYRIKLTIYRRDDSIHFLSYNDDIKVQVKIPMDGTKWSFFDENNNFIGIDKENVWIYGKTEYIDNVSEYISTKEKQFKAIKDAEKQYNNLVDSFRKNGISGLAELDHIYSTNYIIK